MCECYGVDCGRDGAACLRFGQPLAIDAKDTLKRSPTFTGRFIDPWNPDPAQIVIEDIAHHLAVTPRYSGATLEPYSVAQHCVYVSQILPPEKKLAGLLHDAPEYITGDLPHHIKYGPGNLGDCWKRLDSPIQEAIEARFGLAPGALGDPQIKAADDTLFNVEWEELIEQRERALFNVWPWREAERLFLEAYNLYTEA